MVETGAPARDVRRRAADGWLRARRLVLARRRSLAAVLTFAAVAVGLQAARPPAPAEVDVVVAARDLPAGTVLTSAELTTLGMAADAVPAGVVGDPASRTLAAPVRRGEPVTDVRLVGPGLADGHPELTALPVRLPDAGMVALLRVGDRVDLVAAEPRGGRADVVARDALVLALPADGGGLSGGVAAAGLGGRLVVVGVAEREVTVVAAAAVRTFLTFAYSG